MPKRGPPTALSSEEEESLKTFLKDMAKRGLGMGKRDVLQTVKNMLDLSGKRVRYFRNNLPSDSWWCGFLSRNPDLKTMTTVKLEVARAMACSEKKVSSWMEKYTAMLEENNITNGSSIYNCDETGFSFQTKAGKKVVAGRGMKTCYNITSSNKTQITVLICISASGNILPPYILFPGKRMNPSHALDFPDGSRCHVTDKGWMTKDSFYDWMEQLFIPNLPNKSTRGAVVLLLDGHTSHKDFRTSTLARENNIILYCLPAHTTHILQPLDKGFYGPFKGNWSRCCDSFFGKEQCVVDKYTFGRVFTQAYLRTSRLDVIVNSFKSCGVWPPNIGAVDLEKALPSTIFVDDEPSMSKSPKPSAHANSQQQIWEANGSAITDVEPVFDNLDMAPMSLADPKFIEGGNIEFPTKSMLASNELDHDVSYLDIVLFDDEQPEDALITLNMSDILDDQPSTSRSPDPGCNTSDVVELNLNDQITSALASPASKMYESLSPIDSKCRRALEALERGMNRDEKTLFEKKLECGDIEGSGVYIAWRHLKLETLKELENRKREIRSFCVNTDSTNLARKELFKIPEKKRPVKNYKNMPLYNLSSDRAVTELKDSIEKKRLAEEQKRKRADRKEISKIKRLEKQKNMSLEKVKPLKRRRNLSIKQKEKKKEDCNVCKVQFNGGPDEPRWIACDQCDKWFHLHCTELNPHLSASAVEGLR
uniref:uncharacterized protein LOC120336543 n=1 Tax=Styela clava TaxID=7725 RepID=UPI00193A190F|nr:uncharacterized protein LOC120336543 [Styela clava]